MTAVFTAQYRGVCTKCEGEIVKGDQVTFAAFSEVVHVKCPDPPPTCPECHLELPASGECCV